MSEQEQKKPALCIDCEYVASSFQGTEPENYKCRAAENKVVEGVSLVTGAELVRWRFASCVQARTNSLGCSVNAKWFKEKEKEKEFKLPEPEVGTGKKKPGIITADMI